MIGQKLTSKYQTTIPKEVREYLGLKAGDEVIFLRRGNQVVVEKLKYRMEDFVGKFKKKPDAPEDWDEMRKQARIKALKDKGVSRD
jgi:antitoxin PrlF